jgi:hypothetical protein
MITHVIGVSIPRIPILHLLPTSIILPKLPYDFENLFGDPRRREARFGVIDHALRLTQIHRNSIVLILVARVVIVEATVLEEGVVEILSVGEECAVAYCNDAGMVLGETNVDAIR